MTGVRSIRIAARITALALVLAALAPAAAQATTLVWSSPFSINTGQVRDVSCPLASLCVATDPSGHVITSTNPAGGASAWSSATLPLGSGVFLGPVACVPGTASCVAMSIDSSSGKSDVWTSGNPAGGASAWTDRGTITTRFFQAAFELTCPTTSFCIAEDANGEGVRGDPSNASTWNEVSVGNGSSGELSCPSTSFCLAPEQDDAVVRYSTNPTSGSSWTGTDLSTLAGGSLGAASCPLDNVCLVGGQGDVNNLLTSTDPTAGNASAWTATSIGGLTTIERISCPDVHLCVAGDAFGHLGQSADPLGGASTWVISDADGSQVFSSISCANETLCVAVDTNGNAVVGTVPTYPLSVTKAGSGSGTVTSSPAGIDCGSACTGSFANGTTVALTAQPATGSTFTGWSGGGCSGTGVCTVTVNSPMFVTATFTPTPHGQHALTVTKTGSGSGTVTGGGGNISCGSACSANFNDGQAVSLTASPAPGSQFAGWSGACQGTGSCNLTMNADATVTANFVKAQHTLTVFRNNGGHGDITLITNRSTHQCLDGQGCSVSFDEGTVVTLLPSPSPCCGFVGWGGAGCTGVATCRITMDGDKTLLAVFQGSPISVTNPNPAGCTSLDAVPGSPCDITVSCEANVPCSVGADDYCYWDGTQCVEVSTVGFAGDVVRAAARHAPRLLVLSRGHVKIRAHHKGKLHVTFTAAGKRFLRTQKRVRVTEAFIVTTHGHRTLVERTIKLIYRPPHRHGHH